jgi:octaprenyl-diphosphate synthase
MQALNDSIRASLRSEVALINQISEYIIQAGGKRLRPALLLLLARALGLPEAQMPQAHRLAAVIEFIHTATLLHDDIVDESDMRRGRKTANAAFGNAAAVLVGDFLYSRSFQLMVSVGQMRVMEILADATNTIAEGEVLQLLNLGCADVSEASYFKVIEYKTARLFEAAARLAGVLCGVDRATEDRLGEYGRLLGSAFQLIDDVLDYSGDSKALGKNVGDDLREGKPTLPLIHALTLAKPEVAEKIRHAIENGGTQDVDEILGHIQACGSIAYTEARAQTMALAAADIAASLPASVFRDSLTDLCQLAVHRST